MDLYASQSYRLTLLEIQKLAYFLQEAGQPLRLRYEAGHYGPYAPNLNKVLEALERHYTSGYGDSQKPDVEIELLPGAAEEAHAFLAGHGDEHRRLERVSRLIEGFETPYGLELLSSMHWVATHAARRPKTSRTPPTPSPPGTSGSGGCSARSTSRSPGNASLLRTGSPRSPSDRRLLPARVHQVQAHRIPILRRGNIQPLLGLAPALAAPPLGTSLSKDAVALRDAHILRQVLVVLPQPVLRWRPRVGLPHLLQNPRRPSSFSAGAANEDWRERRGSNP